jgi:hypothetical protein
MSPAVALRLVHARAHVRQYGCTRVGMAREATKHREAERVRLEEQAAYRQAAADRVHAEAKRLYQQETEAERRDMRDAFSRSAIEQLERDWLDDTMRWAAEGTTPNASPAVPELHRPEGNPSILRPLAVLIVVAALLWWSLLP